MTARAKWWGPILVELGTKAGRPHTGLALSVYYYGPRRVTGINLGLFSKAVDR